MNGFSANLPKCLRAETLILDGAFFVNGATSPVAASNFGQLAGLMTVTTTATGIHTIVFSAGMTFPSKPVVQCCITMKAGDTAVDVKQVGAFNATTRTLILGTVDYAGAAVQSPAADADRFITFTIQVIDTLAR